MQHLRERWIQFHEISLESTPENAPTIPISQILTRLESRVKKKKSVKSIENGKASIGICDYKKSPTNETVTMLIQYADGDVTDPAFLHMKKRSLRKEPKKDGEGVAVSAHVVISTKPHDVLGLFYRVLVEEVPGLRRSKIAPFLKSEFKEVCKGQFEFHDTETNNNKKKYLPNLEISAKPVKELTSDFKDGVVLQGVEVVQMNPQNKVFDEPGYYKTETSTLRVTVEHKGPVLDVVERITKKAKSAGYDNVRLRYKKASGKSKTTEFGATKADLVDALVGHSELVTSTSDLDQCMEKIVTSVEKQMIQHLVKERV